MSEYIISIYLWMVKNKFLFCSKSNSTIIHNYQPQYGNGIIIKLATAA